MRISDLRFLLALIFPMLALRNAVLTPEKAFTGALIFWWGMALVDQFWPGAQKSPAPAAEGQSQAYFSWVLRLYVPIQLLLIGLAMVSAGSASWPVVLGLGFAVGFLTGAQGITFAHELGHSKSRFDRFLGWVLMTSVGYGHFMVEHYRGHHPRAATFDDPASARRGESLYRFLPRTLWGSWVGGWRLEAQRLQQMRKNWWQSPLVWSTAVFIIILMALSWITSSIISAEFATKIVVFLLIQSAIAVLLLETVNYIEHYGLRRNTVANGKFEPFGIQHAWNADHVASNSLLANLQRHSDHHLHAWKPFAALEALPGPQLPTGYPGCLILAAIPPLWFRLMHRRLDALKVATPQPGAAH